MPEVRLYDSCSAELPSTRDSTGRISVLDPLRGSSPPPCARSGARPVPVHASSLCVGRNDRTGSSDAAVVPPAAWMEPPEDGRAALGNSGDLPDIADLVSAE